MQTDSHNPLLLDQQICFALYAASRAMTAAYRPLLEPLGLTYPQYIVMLVLWERDGLTVGELGERLMLDSGTLTPLLKRLESAGLVSRHRRASDERQVEIGLTRSGRALRTRAEKIPACLMPQFGMGKPELVRLRSGLHDLTDHLQSHPQGESP